MADIIVPHKNPFCPKNDEGNGLHEPDWKTVRDGAPHDCAEVDCRHCGRVGSVEREDFYWPPPKEGR